jgi:hypothetical protein
VDRRRHKCLPSTCHTCLGLISSSASPSSQPGEGCEQVLTDTEPTCQRASLLPKQQQPPHDENARREGRREIIPSARPVSTDQRGLIAQKQRFSSGLKWGSSPQLPKAY